MNASAGAGWQPFDFGSLPSFSRRQAVGWNVLRRFFAGGAGWETWIAEGLTEFFDSPSGFEIRLRQKHTMDSRSEEAVFASEAGGLTLGRDEACDVRLAPRSVGNRHARLFSRAGRCYIEDLGSALGTFLNESRLTANRPAQLTTGDQFAIFPYTFTVELTERWVRDAPAKVYAGPLTTLAGWDPQASVAMDQTLMAIQVQPVGTVFLLETSRTFLEKLSARLLGPLGPGMAERLGLTPVDKGFFELLVAAVLERINRDLPFPFQAALAPVGSVSTFRSKGGALTFSFAIGVGDLTGAFRLVMPDEAMKLLASSAAPPARVTLPEVSWAFPLSAGHVELNGEEAALIECGDVVLLTREMSIVFPNAPERGWLLRVGSGNLSHAVIDNYFERACLSETGNKVEVAMYTGAAPDVASLPIRMHAIVGEKEMTLGEANLLAPGVIVELDGIKSDPVRIALNGKIAGVGELVEVDGRLGVRILSWRTP